MSKPIFENIFGGGKPCMEAKNTSYYLASHPKLMVICNEIFRRVEVLCEAYKNVLTTSEISKANMLAWGCESVKSYDQMFLYNVLMAAYRVYDCSHERYDKILLAIAKNNPEWLDAYKNNYASKIRACRVSIYK